MKQIGAIVEGVEAAANRTITAESRLNDKLKMLRDNIKQARAQAEKVSYFCSTEEKHSDHSFSITLLVPGKNISLMAQDKLFEFKVYTCVIQWIMKV